MLRKLYPMLLFAIALPALAQEPEGGNFFPSERFMAMNAWLFLPFQ